MIITQRSSAMENIPSLVFDYINETHFAHEKGPSTCKMIIEKGPTLTPHLCSHSSSELCEASPIAGILSATGGLRLMINMLRAGPLYVIKKCAPGTHFHDQKHLVTSLLAS